MLRALIESQSSFRDLDPIGYGDISLTWIVDLTARGSAPVIHGPFRRGEVQKKVPIVGDRSGSVSETNLKPALLVDRAKYALGVVAPGRVDPETVEHRGFRALVDKALTATGDAEVAIVSSFLNRYASSAPCRAAMRLELMKPTDVVAFRTSPIDFLFERQSSHAFWRQSLEENYASGTDECCLCGRNRKVLRILPWQVELLGYSCPVSSFNKNAFDSFGKEQTANSPICFDCGSKASQILQYLLDSDRHRRILARDDSKGEGKSPLRNQVAVFWVKDQVRVADGGADVTVDFEAAVSEALGRAEPPLPPPNPEHVNSLLGLPWSHYSTALHLDRNRFYLAVLSPNKSRLVIREWIDESLDLVWDRIRSFDAARTIVDPDGDGESRVTIAEMISSLKPWRSTSDAVDPNHVRGLLRMAYTGARSPTGLLEKAVQRFRVPDRAEKQKDAIELARRSMALAATMKVALFYQSVKEASTVQTLGAARSCGELLAILEEAQGRSSRWRINTTLVDRYYGSASTAPASILALLLKQATQAHLPKVRKENLGYDKLSGQIEEVMMAIEQAGGFPRTLTMREQAEFALGFYCTRAALRAEHKKIAAAPNTAAVTGGQNS